jgi:hypothetical protein
VPQALSACLFLSIGLFVKGEKLVPQPQSIIIDSVTTTRTRQNVNIDLIQCCMHMPYKIHCYIFLYLRTLRNTACARLLFCYIPSRNITISELTICIKPKITNQKDQKLKDHVKSVLRISSAHYKWAQQI